MKRTRALITVILILSIAGIFNACSLVGPNTAATGKPSAASAAPSDADIAPATDSVQTLAPASASASAAAPSQSPSTAPSSGLKFEEKMYSEGSVKIKYPQITGMSDSAAQEKLNKIIADTALRDLKELENGSEYELNYKVTFNTPSVLSMYFDGYGYTPGAAHPYQFLRTLTLDVGKQETIPLTALVSINKGFIDILLNGKYSAMGYDMTDEYRSSIRDYLTQTDAESWINDLRNADTETSWTFSYLTEDALAISVSAPHVMGDHIEILLNYKDLAGYQTDNLIWKAIER